MHVPATNFDSNSRQQLKTATQDSNSRQQLNTAIPEDSSRQQDSNCLNIVDDRAVATDSEGKTFDVPKVSLMFPEGSFDVPQRQLGLSKGNLVFPKAFCRSQRQLDVPKGSCIFLKTTIDAKKHQGCHSANKQRATLPAIMTRDSIHP